ncbi:hypothetical protein MMC12_008669 [Toensbergia leucococca]|nr:hypothetical protein [Toensbergia leucococca]
MGDEGQLRRQTPLYPPNDSPLTESSKSSSTVTTIVEDGDLVLQSEGNRQGAVCLYRVSWTTLRKASAYFNVLLDPSKFSEGATVQAKLSMLPERRRDQPLSISTSALPIVKIFDLGTFPDKFSNKDIFGHFLSILHGSNSRLYMPDSSTQFVALLAIVADRFASTKPIADFVLRNGLKKAHSVGLKEISKDALGVNNELWRRQRLLIGLLLGFRDWVYQYSTLMIQHGSINWETMANTGVEDKTMLWWYLPEDLEGTMKNATAKGVRLC